MASEKVKKGFGIATRILAWIIVAVAVFMMIFTVFSVLTFDRSERNLFGFKFFIVQTDSMAATDFKSGDIVIAKEVDISTLKEGDIITFMSESAQSDRETITHKIRRVTTDANGDIAFVTYGTTTNVDDEYLARIVYGKYVGHIPNLGFFFQFLKSVPGYIVCILVPFLLLILYNGINVIRLFRKYKKEQTAEMDAEREKLEQERAETQRMMAELLELKAKLAGQESPDAAKETAEADAPSAVENVAVETATETTEDVAAEAALEQDAPAAEDTPSPAPSEEKTNED